MFLRSKTEECCLLISLSSFFVRSSARLDVEKTTTVGEPSIQANWSERTLLFNSTTWPSWQQFMKVNSSSSSSSSSWYYFSPCQIFTQVSTGGCSLGRLSNSKSPQVLIFFWSLSLSLSIPFLRGPLQIAITFIFNNFFSSLARSKYFSLFRFLVFTLHILLEQ